MIIAAGADSQLTLWTAVGAVIGAITVLFTVAGFVVRRLKARQLICRMTATALRPTATRAMSASLAGGEPGQPGFSWNGVALSSPWLLTLTLANYGWGPIALRDTGPLKFKVGADIVALLNMSPKDRTGNDPQFDRDALTIRYADIGRGRPVTLTLLAEGQANREPLLVRTGSQPESVTVTMSQATRRAGPGGLALSGYTALAVVLALASGLAGFTIGHQGRAGTPVPAHSGSRSPAPSKSSSPAGTLTPAAAAAAAKLGSESAAVQLAGITALGQAMRAHPGEQPVLIGKLAGYIRHHSRLVNQGNNDQPVTRDIQAALNVLRHRNPAADGDTPINLAGTNLSGATLAGIDLAHADLSNDDLSSANLDNANLSGADLSYAYLGQSTFTGSNIGDAGSLHRASFPGTPWCESGKPVYPNLGYTCAQ